MKKGLIISLAVAAVAAAVSSLLSIGVSAGPLRESDPRAAADDRADRTIPARRIAAGVRAAGLDPDGEPVLRGRYYVLRAFDLYGTEMRVVADAEFGDILSIVPARRRTGAYQSSYGSGPRIIHIPQSDDAQAEADYRDNVSAPEADNGHEPPARSVTRPPVRQIPPAKRDRSAAPPPVKRNIVTSAPPPPPRADDKKDEKDKALTPIYPTPDFGANAGSGGKFEPQLRQN